MQSGIELGSGAHPEDGPGKESPPSDGSGRTGPRRARGRGRRTRGILRKFDTWSVFRVSVLFYFAVYCVLLVAGVILWAAASATGLRGNVENFIADLIASGKFEFVGSELFRASVIGGAVLVVLGAAGNVLLVVLYNLISEVVGGISVVVEELPPRRRRRRAEAEPVPAAETKSAAPAILVPEAELKQPRRSPERTPSVVRQTPS